MGLSAKLHPFILNENVLEKHTNIYCFDLVCVNLFVYRNVETEHVWHPTNVNAFLDGLVNIVTCHVNATDTLIA